MKKTGKKTEMEDLALLMQRGFGEIHQKMATKTEMEDLAAMTQRGFGEIHQKMATKTEVGDLALLMQRGFGEIHQKMATKTEVEDLAAMTQRGFEEIQGKFKDVRSDLRDLEIRLEDRIDSVGARLGSYVSDSEKKFDDLHEWHEEVDGRINKIEDRIAGTR